MIGYKPRQKPTARPSMRISFSSVIFKSFYPHGPGIFPVLRFPEYRGMDIFSLHENAQKIKPAGLFFTEKS